jgi:RHS repeat-associated protein
MAILAEEATLNTYTYDSDGFKKVENVGGNLSTIIWDGPNYLQVRNQTSSTNKTFHTVESQMMSYIENTFRFDLLTDNLGSVTAIVDGSQIRIFDTRYSAYGRNRWITGTSCGFGWVGSYGYRETGLFHMSHYVRARHYSYVTGDWSTVDPLWPDESAYGYVNGRSPNLTDPSGRAFVDCSFNVRPCGMSAIKPCKKKCGSGLIVMCAVLDVLCWAVIPCTIIGKRFTYSHAFCLCVQGLDKLKCQGICYGICNSHKILPGPPHGGPSGNDTCMKQCIHWCMAKHGG